VLKLRDLAEPFLNITRTTFAIYITTTLASVFLHIGASIHSQDIRLSLPCPDALWHAQSQLEFDEALRNMQHDANSALDFKNAVYYLLHHSTWRDCGHETFSTFTQYICLAAVLEAICATQKLALNYANADEWQRGRRLSAESREMLTHTLDVCKSLWLVSSEDLWEKMEYAHPQEENNLLLRYMFVLVNGSQQRDELCDEDDYWVGLQAAVDMFVDCSRAGFSKVGLHTRDAER
jgi:hypothetical protein